MTAARPRSWILALALGLFAAVPLAATSFVGVSDEALVDQARVAVVARVVSADPRAGGGFATEYVVEVERTLKGTAPGRLRVRTPGGEGADGLALTVHGAPRFRAGERVLLFLEPHGGPGGFRVLHLFLGAFHRIEAGGRALAVRDLAGATELRVREDGAPVAVAAESERPRDFDAFARWAADRAAGKARPADYRIEDPGGTLRRSLAKYSFFVDPEDGERLRWFEFDAGAAVLWRVHASGQAGILGGGLAELRTALQAWNDDPGTLVDYRYEGATDATAGLHRPDGVNTVLFNDPEDLVPDFHCGSGGIVAVGGPFHRAETRTREGRPYHPIAEADVVLNDGLDCFFAASSDSSKLIEEILGHELGHTLGLGHACGDPSSPPCRSNPALNQALMRAYVHHDGRGARLDADDRNGARVLYGVGEAPPAPFRLQAVAVSPVEVRLSWKLRIRDAKEVRVEARTVDGVFVDVGAVDGDSNAAILLGLDPATSYVFRVRAVRGGAFSGYSNEARATTPTLPLPCLNDGRTLCLRDGRFRARVRWAAPDGRSGLGSVMPVPSGDSGIFWFFSPDNLELLVKVLDGCEGNGHYWVFTGPATNLQYVLTVTDTLTGKTRVYFQPQGASLQGLSDNLAFGDCP
ncbi:MAG TPA: fibronectin type III domain-containing protein [Thermoanaerobaculia bacterium]|nr:fibronectin type III domain-containing protein [Thermoanaerobaculia bacterium]